MKEFEEEPQRKSYLYYGVFFLISGVIHFFMCFYTFNPPKTVIKVPLAMMKIKKKISKPKPKSKTAKPKPKKTKPAKPKPKKTKPTKPKKAPNVKYRENLEKKLREQWQHKMKKMEEQNKKALAKLQQQLKKQKQQEIEKLKQQHIKQQQELAQAKQKQQQLNKQLTQKLTQVTQKLLQMEQIKKQQRQEMEKLKQDNKRQLQQAIDQKLKKMEKRNHKYLAKLKQKQEQVLQAKKQEVEKEFAQKKAEMQKLSSTLQAIGRQKLKELRKIRNERQQMQQQRTSMKNRQQMLEKALREEKRQLETKMARQQANLLAKQQELEKKVLQQKRLREQASRHSPSQERKYINQQWKSLEKLRASSLGQHKEFIRKFATTSDKGVVVPSLDFFGGDFKRNLYDIMNFHKMKLIAFPAKSHYYISIDLNKARGYGRYRRSTDFAYLSRNFNRRSISAEAGFPALVSDIRTSNIYSSSDGALYLALICPHGTANYLAWKSVTVCKKFGYDPKNVAICRSFFRRTRTGFWSLIIDSLVLKDGRTVSVDDFEENW